MRQEDFVLKEIEKIGIIFSRIREKLLGRGEVNLSISIEKQMDEMKGMLFNELNFDIDNFLNMDFDQSIKYLSQYKGFNISNIEDFAGVIFQMGQNAPSDKAKKLFEKALQLFEYCNYMDKTYSIDRELNIGKIKDALAHPLKGRLKLQQTDLQSASVTPCTPHPAP